MQKFDDLIQSGRVHRSIYTDTQIFALEQQRIFSGTWIYLAHASEIDEPNSFVIRKMGARTIIVTRDKKNNIHALINRCTHRGATICREKKGNKNPFLPALTMAGHLEMMVNVLPFHILKPMVRNLIVNHSI